MRGKAWIFLGGVGLGALIMYFLDPRQGNHRRGVVRDKIMRTGRRAGDAIEGGAKDMADRARGIAAKVRSRLGGDEGADELLAQRVRDALDRVVSHPGHLTISAEGGEVTLGGIVSEEEANALSATVRQVRGVTDVIDETQVREEVAG